MAAAAASSVNAKWLETTAAAFEALKITDGQIPAAEFVAACKEIVPVYDILFAGGMVANTLKGDIQNSIKTVETVLEAKKGTVTYVQELVNAELAAHGKDKVRYDKASATIGALWLMRAVLFNTRFVELLTEAARHDAAHCAKTAYAEVLKPYHGFLISGVVSMAMGMVPSRESLIETFGFSDEASAMPALKRYVSAVKGVFSKLAAFYAEKGINFEDKV